MSGNVQEVASAIKDIIVTGGQIPGSRLSASLKARFPTWSPTDSGSRSLREFIATHVLGVVVAGRSGMDVIYALEGAAPSHKSVKSVAPALPTNIDFWRVWVSPNSPHALAVNREGTELRAVSRGSSVEPSQVLLEPPGLDVHREVAHEFLSKIPAALQVKLQAVLDSTNKQWWHAWLRELRGSEHHAAWNTFRRQKFEERLSTQLRAAGLEQSGIANILKTVRECHALVLPREQRPYSESFQQDDGATLRRIVVEAVQRMSVSELRELKLPIGIVFDVLATSKSR